MHVRSPSVDSQPLTLTLAQPHPLPPYTWLSWLLLVCEPLPHLLQLQVWATHPTSEPLSGHLRALSSAQGRKCKFNNAVSSALSFLSTYTGFPQQSLASVCLDLGQQQRLRDLESVRYTRNADAAKKRGGAAPRKAVIGDEGERAAPNAVSAMVILLML